MISEGQKAAIKQWRQENPEKWKQIHYEAGKRFRLANPDKMREYRRRYAKTHRAQIRAYAVKRRKRLRGDIIKAYGAVCALCGETNRLKLTLDHIWGDGAQHRKARTREGVHLDVRRAGFPKDKYRLLCASCNTKEWARLYKERPALCPRCKRPW